MERRQRRIFPEAFKREAVDRVATSGLSMKAVARELGVHDNVVLPTAVLRLVSMPGARRLLEAYAKLPPDSGEHMIAFLEKIGAAAPRDDLDDEEVYPPARTREKELMVL